MTPGSDRVAYARMTFLRKLSRSMLLFENDLFRKTGTHFSGIMSRSATPDQPPRDARAGLRVKAPASTVRALPAWVPAIGSVIEQLWGLAEQADDAGGSLASGSGARAHHRLAELDRFGPMIGSTALIDVRASVSASPPFYECCAGPCWRTRPYGP